MASDKQGEAADDQRGDEADVRASSQVAARDRPGCSLKTTSRKEVLTWQLHMLQELEAI